MRLIDADELELWLKRVGKFLKCEEDSKRVTKLIGKIIDHVNNAPTVEARPVVHGRWVDNGIPESMLSRCSVCGYSCGAYSMNFCPNCGCIMKADMRGGKND